MQLRTVDKSPADVAIENKHDIMEHDKTNKLVSFPGILLSEITCV